MGEHVRVQTQTFRPTSSRVLAVAAWAVALSVAVGALTTRDLGVAATAASGAGLGAVVAWALFWRPQIEVSPGGVTIVNVVRTIHVPWPVLTEAVAGWSLEVRTREHTWTAWAAPRGSAAGEAARRRSRGGGPLGRLTGGAQPATAEAVAAAIAQAHETLVAGGHLDGAQRRAQEARLRETVTWHVATIAAALTLLCVVVAAAVA